MKSHYKLKLFIRFLKENNIYHKFFTNIYSNNGRKSITYQYKSVREYIDEELKDRGCLINKSFLWAETEEGYVFWRGIYDKWEEIRFLINKI